MAFRNVATKNDINIVRRGKVKKTQKLHRKFGFVCLIRGEI